MIRGTAALEEALRASHQPEVTAEVWQSNRRIGTLEIAAEGSVKQAGDQFQIRSGTIVVRPTDETKEWLKTPGACVRVWRGIKGIGRGIPVLWGPARAPKSSSWSASLEVSVEDLSRRVVKDEFPSPRKTLLGATTPQMIQVFWRESVPWATWDDNTLDGTAIPDLTFESDRSQAITELEASIGARSWMRPDGSVVLRRTPTAFAAVDLNIRERVNLSSDSVTSDWDSVYNHCIVRSDNTDNPVTGEYADWDSSTGISQIGRSVLRVTTGAVTTNAQADTMAQTLVIRSQGARVSGEWTSVIHPGVEVNDVHYVRSQLGSHRFIVDSADWDLFGAGMSLTGRIPSLADNLTGEG